MPDKKSVTMEQCMDNIRTYIHRPENLEMIEKAWKFADHAHEGQKRKSGEPYVIHVIQVANILAGLHCSPKTIAAGLLHDTIEDCDEVTYETISEEFSPEIADLVEAVTKVGRINREFKDEKEYLASNHRKIFIAMAKDIRVILIKLADRLHNMRTLEYQPPEKQQKIARETLQVYAPIAHRLGISKVKNELEDLSFKYLYPNKYQSIKRLVADRETQRNAQVNEMIQDIETILDEFNIPYRIFGRSKHFYSIYKKMVTKHKRFEEILDLQAIRIVTDSIPHCYEVLGYIHATYMPIPGRFKDYIAMPKSNMYQSLHTTVVQPASGNIFEIQIRTEDMDSIAEKGVAAHWLYKENGRSEEEANKEMEDKLSWFRDFSIITDEESEDPLEYMSVVQKDIFEANVYCFTPRGKVVSLPSGATPIDFAYRIHTEVGNKTVGAVVNGAIVPLNTPLKTGDVVNILTNKNSAGPSPDWVKIVKSAHARNKIRSFFQKQEIRDQREAVKIGEAMLEEELKKQKQDPAIVKQTKKIDSILQSLSFRNADDLYAAIASKRVPAAVVVDRLIKNKPALDDNEEIQKIFNRHEKLPKASSCGVIVPGIDTIQVSLAPCCSPIPGDEIVGYVSKGKGVKVHRKDCPNIAKETKRLIPVSWSENLDDKIYTVNLVIHSEDRSYLLSDIVTVLQQNGISLRSIHSSVDPGDLTATTKAEVCVKNAEQLSVLMANLKKVRSVIDIIRTTL